MTTAFIISIIGMTLQTASQNLAMFMVSRVITGFVSDSDWFWISSADRLRAWACPTRKQYQMSFIAVSDQSQRHANLDRRDLRHRP